MMSTPIARGAGGHQGRTPQHGVHSDSDSTQFVESELGSEPGSPSSDMGVEQQRPPLPSQGSAAHGKGGCQPCAWYWKPVGCLKSQDCRYCHLCPDGELKRRRKRKVAMIRMGALESGSQFKMMQVSPIEYRMTIKNTFIHMEAQHMDRDVHVDVVETVTAAGLTFSLRRCT